MSDGTLSVRRRQPKASEQSSIEPALSSSRTGILTSMFGTDFSSIGKGRFKEKGKAKARPAGDVDELKIEARRRRKLRAYDRLLKNFKYSAALDNVLQKVRGPSPCFLSTCMLTNELYRRSHRQQLSHLYKNSCTVMAYALRLQDAMTSCLSQYCNCWSNTLLILSLVILPAA